MKTQLQRGLLVAASAALCAGAVQAQAGTYRTIAEERFDLLAADPGNPMFTPNLDSKGSGFGWVAPWWSGGVGGSHAIVVPANPAFMDQVGNMAYTNKSDLGSYRRLDGAGFENITDDAFGAATGPLFGKDNTTLWISFETQKIPGGDDAYGGLSLFIFLDPNQVGEYLFLGTPYLFDDWGIDTPTGLPGATTIGQGNVDQASHLVYRIAFLPGDEHLQMWRDPATAKPDPLVTAPDLDVMIPDIRFNEVRIQSGTGGGAVGGTVPGMWFDGIKIECEDCEKPDPLEGAPASLSITNGGVQTLDLRAGSDYAGLTYFLLGSLSGTAPGFPIDGLTLPLNFDNYFLHTVSYANQPPLANSFGALDGNGEAQATFTLPVGIIPLFGQTANHAYVVIDLAPFPVVTFASNAVPVTFTN